MKYFIYEFKKATNFGKLFLLPTFYKRLHNFPEKAVIYFSGNPTKKCWEYLDHYFSHIKDSGDIINKAKNLSTIPENSILVRTDVLGLYPSIPYEAALRAFREELGNHDKICIPTEDLFEIADFVLRKKFFEFNSKVKQQVSGTAISTIFAPPYACLFMDKFETSFFEVQQS